VSAGILLVDEDANLPRSAGRSDGSGRRDVSLEGRAATSRG